LKCREKNEDKGAYACIVKLIEIPMRKTVHVLT